MVRDLEEKGVVVVNDVDELAGKPQGTVIIRAHGVERGVCEKIQTLGFSIVDATCPFVLKIHRLVERYSGEDCHIVIVGNASHPEVKGIKSWSNAEDTRVIGTREGAEKYDASHGKKVCIVSQTTFNYNKFQELVEIIKEKGYDIIVLNTICNATEERQTEARAIAEQVDAMIVIGGRNSSNTQKLFEICKNECKNTYYIQTVKAVSYTHLLAKALAHLTSAFAGATCPKVNLITGEAYGTAYVAMNSKSIGADFVYAWPDAKVGMMDADLAVKIMYADASADELAEKAKEYDALQGSVMTAARRGYVDLIVDPADTRKYLVDAFELLYTKCAYTPDKKHGTK